MKLIIDIPQYATNKDVLEAVFSDCTVFRVNMIDKNKNILLHDINYHWLQAPYKENKNETDN